MRSAFLLFVTLILRPLKSRDLRAFQSAICDLQPAIPNLHSAKSPEHSLKISTNFRSVRSSGIHFLSVRVFRSRRLRRPNAAEQTEGSSLPAVQPFSNPRAKLKFAHFISDALFFFSEASFILAVSFSKASGWVPKRRCLNLHKVCDNPQGPAPSILYFYAKQTLKRIPPNPTHRLCCLPQSLRGCSRGIQREKVVTDSHKK